MSRPERGAVARLRSETRYRLVGGQAVVIVQDEGEALVLNEIGSRILELVDGNRSIGDIAERMLAEYEVDREELEADVADYLLELSEARVLDLPEG